MIYLAYGANLNKRNMAVRCPKAVALNGTKLHGYKLVFNNVASIVKSEGDHVEVALWNITEQCEKALDRFEGFPNLYRKEMLEVDNLTVMSYIMNYGGKAVPNKNYFDTIRSGYSDFNLNTEQLVRAVLEAYDYEKNMGNIIPVTRKRRGGRQWN